jgi:hypothetical protein
MRPFFPGAICAVRFDSPGNRQFFRPGLRESEPVPLFFRCPKGPFSQHLVQREVCRLRPIKDSWISVATNPQRPPRLILFCHVKLTEVSSSSTRAARAASHRNSFYLFLFFLPVRKVGPGLFFEQFTYRVSIVIETRLANKSCWRQNAEVGIQKV